MPASRASTAITLRPTSCPRSSASASTHSTIGWTWNARFNFTQDTPSKPPLPHVNRPVMDIEAHRDLKLLEAVEQDSRITQRSLSTKLGIALGLTNVYLKRL